VKIPPHSTLVFIGDSITDAGRVRPGNDTSPFGALGNGYVSQVEALISATHLDQRIRVENRGISGNTVRDLKARWQQDVLDLQPDWVSVMIGINDVWRQFDCEFLPDIHVNLEEYTATLGELARQTRPLVNGFVVMSPFLIEANKADRMRAMMDRYGAAARQVAAENDALFVDVQAAYDAATARMYSMALAADRVHPGAAGHMIIARAFLDAIGYAW
jgi:lysophospholipase L1-like esterase